MLRIGIVGCGRILAAHLRGYRMLRAAGVDDFRITALCARRESDAAMYVQRGSGPPQRSAVSNLAGDPLAVADEYLSDFQDDTEVALYTDYREMIERGPIDAVNDYSTHGLHHLVAEAAAEHGKHLLTQKPLAVTVEAAARMVEAFQERQLVLGTFENWRYAPANRQLQWLVRSGQAGQVQLILVTNVGSWWAPNRIVAETPWRHQMLEAGGITLDIGVHLFDLVRSLGGEIESVQGQIAVLEPSRVTLDGDGQVVESIACDADDTCFATFRTESGVVGSLNASWGGHGGATVLGRGPVLYTTRGRITDGDVLLDGDHRTTVSELYRQHADAEQLERDQPLGLDDGFALTQLDWLRAVASGGQMETSGLEGLRDLAAAYAVLESATLGRRVSLAEVLAGECAAYQRAISRHFFD